MSRVKARLFFLLGTPAIIVIGMLVIAILRSNGARPDLSAEDSARARESRYANSPDVGSSVSKSNGKTDSSVDLNISLPEDVAAMARFYGSDGPPDIKDAAVVWGKETTQYVQCLRAESLEQSAYLTYGTSELILVIGNGPSASGESASIVELLGRTRRMSKLLRQLHAACEQGASGGVVASLSGVIDKLLRERKEVYGELAEIGKEHPERFEANAKMTYEEQNALVDLITGHAFSVPGLPDSHIPLSLKGTALGITANVYLLGLTEHPDAIKPILRVAEFDEDSLRTSVTNSRSFRPVGPYNASVIADALDRVLCAAAGENNEADPAGKVARDYVKWRQTQTWGERGGLDVYAYEMSQENPYSFRGKITGVVDACPGPERTMSLPLTFGQSKYDTSRPPETAKIIEWARSYLKK